MFVFDKERVAFIFAWDFVFKIKGKVYLMFAFRFLIFGTLKSYTKRLETGAFRKLQKTGLGGGQRGR